MYVIKVNKNTELTEDFSGRNFTVLMAYKIQKKISGFPDSQAINKLQCKNQFEAPIGSRR